ncbi:SH3 and multiple ankyrin repeat domains protein 3 [Schistosoma japonicum]|nr:SH3 and multiple ankyrin repeat domains protein 3 [Schistosoma japonicum]
MCDSDSGLSISMNGSQNDSPTKGLVFIRITMPDETNETFSFSPTDLVMDVKLTVISRPNFSLKDELNYGLFFPPSKGKAGKFLQEERMLLDYPFESSVGHLELKYKQRVYRDFKTNINKFRKINTKSNFRQFIENVKMGDVDKVNKWLNKGMDPNFQWKQNGETPLTLAVQLEKPYEMIMALVAGGAHLDYRASDSMTPIHRASVKGSYEAIKVLLDLGQSPNTRDKADLTPLYYAVLNNAISLCIERLLFDHSPLGITDESGLQEIHQACRFGRVQHLEILLAYGAEINAQTSKNGNTPLHICAYTGQESCTRMLLFRGADKNIKNFNGYSAYEQAMISNHIEIADLIKNFHEQDVVPIRNYSKRNDRRRSFSRTRSKKRCSSMGRLNEFSEHADSHSGMIEKESLTTYGQKHCDTLKNTSIIRSKTWMDASISSYNLMSDSIDFIDNKNNPVDLNDQNDHIIQSSSACNLNRLSNSMNQNCHNPNDRVYLNYAATMRPSQSLHVGRSSTQTAPRTTSESFKTNHLHNRHSTYRPTLDPAWMSQANENGSDTVSIFSTSSFMKTGSTNSLKNASAILQLLLANRDSIADLDTTNLPRMIALQRGPNGFGFIVRGKKGISKKFTPSLECPASQYLERVEPQSVASRAGLKAGDFILEVNNINVTTMSHEAVVSLIRGSRDILTLKVITLDSDQINAARKLSQLSVNSNRFCESSDNIYNSEFRKYNYDSNFSNDFCEPLKINLSNNIENTCKTVCRGSFHKSQDTFARQSHTSAGELLTNSLSTEEKLKSLRLESSSSISSTMLPAYRIPAPPPLLSKPMMLTSTLSKNGLQNRPNNTKKEECLTLNLKPKVSEKTFGYVHELQTSASPNHPPPPTPPPVSSNNSNVVSIPSPLINFPNNISFNIKPEVPTGILKKALPNTDTVLESAKVSSNPLVACNQDSWSDQLILPPPPPPEDFELCGAESTARQSKSELNSDSYEINKQRVLKTNLSPQVDEKLSFEDNLRRAVAQRRRLIEMASDEVDHDFNLKYNKGYRSTLYTEKNTKSLERQNEIISSDENSLKTAAEKLHRQALSHGLPTSSTIPPPEKFKDFDNPKEKADCNTESKNSSMLQVETKPTLSSLQSSFIKNVGRNECLTNGEEIKYSSVKFLTNNSVNSSYNSENRNSALREITVLKKSDNAESRRNVGMSFGYTGPTTASPLQPSRLIVSDVSKTMWSTK